MKNLSEPLKDVKVFPSCCRIVHCSPGWHGNTTSDSNKFFYVLEGSIILNISNNNYIVQKNHLALLPANIHHSFWLLPGVSMKMIDFGFNIQVNGEDLFSYYGCTEKNHVIPFPEKEMLDIHSRMTAISGGDSYSYVLWSAEIARLCAMYVKARADKEKAKKEFDKVISYMREHIAEDISLEVLASLANYETTYFSAKFKQETGLSPLKYFAHLRTQEAARLISGTDMSVADIAAAVGYSNVYYFDRFFMQHMGVSPKCYKDIFLSPSYLRETKG